MAVNSRIHSRQVIGSAPERLSPEKSLALAGKWAAFEIYTPATTPLRRIEALGGSVEECIRQLTERGLDPRRFEFVPMKPPY
jgi:hypothetical protein